jgi:hypothetical protein
VTRPERRLAYVCHPCGITSVHPGDVEDRYCGKCHQRHTGDVVVWTWDDPWKPGTCPVLREPRIGCSTVSHDRLGWCNGCPRVKGVEVLGWRLDALDAVVPGYAGAVAISAMRR